MIGSWVLDLLLLLLLVGYVVSGYRRGLLHSVCALAGVAMATIQTLAANAATSFLV